MDTHIVAERILPRRRAKGRSAKPTRADIRPQTARPRPRLRISALASAAIAAALLGGVPEASAFPGENGKIAFDRAAANQPSQIYVMSADGSGQSPLTAGTGPAWSADGSRVAFSRAGNLNEDIYVVNADGSGETQLTRNRPDVYLRDSSPTWSPDGTKIAFASTRDKEAGYTEVYVMSADGSAQTRLTYTPGLGGSAHSPAWSPDGTRIAFASNQHGAGQEVYLMDPDGSAQTRLTYTPSGHSGRPAWSPDGRKIAFNSTRDGNAEIYVMNADGSGQARLTYDPEREIKPAWSPDGRKIAFTSSRDTPNHRDQIWVMNADGSGQTNLSNSGANDWLPDWQALNPPPPPPPLPPLPPPPPRPDFAISRAGFDPVVLAPGGSARVTLTLRRFNGSTGPISLAAYALPAGVSASFAPNPAVGGDGEHVTLTLSARAEARAVTNTRVSVAGVAQRDSAGTAPREITFLLTVAGRVDLRARGVDVIQASQTGGILIPSGLSQGGEYRGVELAAGAKTIARVYTDATGAGRTGVPVAVALYGYDSATGRPLPGSPIFPFEGPSRVSERPLPLVLPEERVDPDGAHTFVLPPAWTRGKITLAAQVSPPERRFVDENPVLECEELGCSRNNRFSLTEVEFTRTRGFTIAPIAITREGGRAIPGPASAFYATRAVIPIGEQQLTIPDSYRTTIDNSAIANATTPPNPNSDPNDDARELEDWKGGATKALVEAWDARNAKLGDVTIGINDGAVRGRASGRSAIARFDQGRGAPSGNQRPLTSVAHETFHLLGRPHASGECGGKDGGSFEDWPPDGRGRLQGIGLDRRRSYNPGPFRVFEDRGSSVYYDFMSYCASVGSGDPDAWVSPRNWEAVLRRRREFGTVVGPDAGAARVANAAAASLAQLAVRGYASPTGSAITSVEPAAPARMPEPPASGFRLVARNAAGAVVGEAPVAATPDAEGDLTMLDGAVRAPGAAKVEIVRDGAVVAERRRSPHRPRVRVLSPRRGARVGGHPRVVVRWSARDADRARCSPASTTRPTVEDVGERCSSGRAAGGCRSPPACSRARDARGCACV